MPLEPCPDVLTTEFGKDEHLQQKSTRPTTAPSLPDSLEYEERFTLTLEFSTTEDYSVDEGTPTCETDLIAANEHSQASKNIINILTDIKEQSNKQIKAMRMIVDEKSDAAEYQISKDFHDVCELLDQTCHTGTKQSSENCSEIINIKKSISEIRHNKINAKITQEQRETALKRDICEMKAVVERHQRAIDKLMIDKITLTERAEDLLQQIETRTKQFQFKIKAMESRHVEEIRKAREMSAAAEKTRLNDTITKEKKRIKEATLKAIQGDLEAMQNKHEKREIELTEVHKQEVNRVQMESQTKLQEKLEELRQKLTTSNEKMLSNEIEKLKAHHALSMAAEQKSFEEERKRWSRDFAQRNAECEAREEAAKVEKLKAVERAKQQWEDELGAVRTKHNTELNYAKDNLELELQKMKLDMRRNCASMIRTKEVEIRNEAVAARDMEIEKIINEFEALTSKLKEDHKTEIRSLNVEYDNSKKIMEDRIHELQDMNHAMKIDLGNLHKLYKDQLLRTKEELENSHLEKESLLKLNSELQIEKKKIIEKHGQDMKVLHSKIKDTIGIRDGTISKLQHQIDMLKAAIHE